MLSQTISKARGMFMNIFWEAFRNTGSLEAYLTYKKYNEKIAVKDI